MDIAGLYPVVREESESKSGYSVLSEGTICNGGGVVCHIVSVPLRFDDK